ncbi:hypothetical protein ACS0TY_011085 [Phlomoides rotata]
MGKNEEAVFVYLNAKEILCIDHSNVYVDDLTLSTLQIVFQRFDHLYVATGCYEHACTKYPNNLELIMGIFNCYVREYSFVKQQQGGLKNLLQYIKDKDPNKASVSLTSTLDTLAQLELL